MFRRISRLALVFACAAGLLACGDDDGDDGGVDAGPETGLDDFLPEIPEPTGDSQSVYAGVIDGDNAAEELIPGPAASGLVGDIYLRNARGRFVIQGPDRVIGVIPQGGNLVDMQPIGPDGPVGEDHFGELSSVYVLGRTCEHTTIEVLQDGSGGGVAAIRARGVSAANDFFNLKGIGLLPVQADLDPDIPDSVECATTYILQPDSPTVEVLWTFYNGGESSVRGPLGALNDTGGNVEVWAPTRGFERLGIEALLENLDPAPVPYALYQGPGVAYGIVPQHEVADTPNASFFVAGVSIVLFGADELLDIVRPEGGYLELEPAGGVTHGLHVIVGNDAADIDAAVLEARGEASQEIAGRVEWSDGEPAAGARVGVFADADGDGAVSGDEVVVSYLDTDESGAFSGRVAEGGAYLARADVADQARSAPVVGTGSDIVLQLPSPVRYDYRLVDDETEQAIPAKLIVLGANPAAADRRLFSTYDRFTGVVATILASHGTSVGVGDGADPAIHLAPGADYRVLAMRGTEWSVASVQLSPVAGETPPELELRLRRVVDTAGYIASEYHVHSVGSPDSPVDWPIRVATAAVDGVEVFASTEHDYIADLQPIAEELGLARWVRILPGIEVTPFAYGHFNAWPIEPDDSANHGAIDWARGEGGFALVPGEIFERMRERGAELVQVNHPRALPSALVAFQQYFDRAGLTFDYVARTIAGDELAQPVPSDYLRLAPGEQLWDLSFNALEVWNGFGMADSDDDGVREIQALDLVMRDWFNFLSFGFPITPIGSSDTHTITRDPMGMPRTMVAVADDSAEALESGSVVDPIYDTLAGRRGAPRDVVVTNGPHIRVTRVGETESVIGRVLEGAAAELTISVQSPDWAPFDVIEVFANAVPELGADITSLSPVRCYVLGSPKKLPPTDPCASAPLGVEQITVDEVEVGDFLRFEAEVTFSVAAADPVHPEGGTGDDAWIVVRARGRRGIYPILLNDIISSENLGVLVNGTPDEVNALLEDRGVPASAFTAPIYLDLDGGGYLAPFAPE